MSGCSACVPRRQIDEVDFVELQAPVQVAGMPEQQPNDELAVMLRLEARHGFDGDGVEIGRAADHHVFRRAGRDA